MRRKRISQSIPAQPTTDTASPLVSCHLCPWQCGIDRLDGKIGRCRAGAAAQVFRYGPHAGEEPPLSGTRGSGAVFFGRCTLRCLYCQNHPWSQGDAGDRISVIELCGMLNELRKTGCHNWNLVSPTPWLPLIRDAWRMACDEGPGIPVIYNTSGYECVDTLECYADMADIYLTDLRYADPATAAEASGARDYVAVARRALRAMWQRRGPLVCDENGIAVSGTICRLLIIPGHADEVVRNLEWIAAELGVTVPVSVMAQYVPTYRAIDLGPWNRGIDRKEYDIVCEAVDRLGFEVGWVQEFGGPPAPGLLGHQMAPGSGIGPDSNGKTVRKERP